jgi:protein SCO1/2
MRQKSWARAIAVGSILVLTILFFVTFDAFSAEDNGEWGADYFPNVPLTTQDGATVHFYDDLLKGKIVAIDLIYTHCKDMCPLETARMAQVQRILGDRVGKDIFFYSISIDPERDTPAELAAFAEKYHVKPGWLFLTGKPEDIQLIIKKLGLYSDSDLANRDGHTAYVLLGNEATGQWMRNSAVDNPQFLAAMIGGWLSSWKDGKARKSYAEAPPISVRDKGHYIFATHCAACHSIGHGDHVGPDLLGVTTVREQAWLSRFIAEPDKMLAEKDPLATALFAKYKQVNMPNLRLSSVEIDAVLNYLKTQSAAPPRTEGVQLR